MARHELDYFPKELRDRFTPKRQLGMGSMGRVYLAVDKRLRHLVAVKVMPHCYDASVEARLEREAKALERFRHPHVMRVFDFGHSEVGPYLVAEYLRGQTLAEVEGEQDVERIALQVAEGLHAVHKEGLLHRDVKPDNIFVTNKGRAVLVDFGLVHDPGDTRLTSTGGVIGTMHYMAPEVMMGEKASPACDWYSWGATLYFLVERKVPFDRTAIIGSLTTNEPPELTFEVTPEGSALERVIRRSLSWDPDRRPRGLKEVKALLGR